ncbi:MAG TPA: hypothetical protein VFA75_03040 [Nevskia sp.]|jgi:hypothetical protein|nr:hypothetical protein [Nevskia sp.]
MRRFPVLSRFLIALGFVAVQAMAVVHATSHELKPDSSAACEICALAHAAGGAPVVVDAATCVPPDVAVPVLSPLAAALDPPFTLPPSRGPPFILA